MALPLVNVESAQAVIYVENLSELRVGGWGINSSYASGPSFTTDNSSYTLNSVTADIFLNDSNFSILLYTSNGSEPGTVVETLNTTDSIVPELKNYLYTPDNPVNLDANTTYWLIGSTTSGNPRWSYTNSLNESSPGDWTIGNNMTASTDGGSSWSSSDNITTKFNVDADVASTAVPFEFSPAMGLLLMGGLFGGKAAYGKYRASKVKL